MCYVCNCFAWTLDLVQRFITFALGCIMSIAICCGISVAVVAGIAYGYNYSLAEFLTFARSDVTVYVRRGQFLDKPDLEASRRSGGETYDLLSPNITSDYQEESGPVESNPLSNTWRKAEDTRRYAEKLTKYSSQAKLKEKHFEPMMRPESLGYYKFTTAPQPFTSIIPNHWMSTTAAQRDKPEIIMRKFQPVEQLLTSVPDKSYDYANFDTSEKAKSETDEQSTETDTPDAEIQEDDGTKSNPRRTKVSTTDNPAIIIDYAAEDTDEDNIAYKPV